MPQLSQSDKAERYDRDVEKKKHRKVLDHVNMLRITETAVNAVASVALGALKEARPAWETAAYGLPIDGATTALGGAIFIMAPDRKSGDYMREVGGGLMQAGVASLGQKGGRKLYSYLAAA